MADGPGIGAASGVPLGSALDRQTDSLLQRFGNRKTGAAALANKAAGSASENSKIEKSAKDFESILLGTWLQQAEQSFAKVPGGDGEDDDADPGKDQLQGMAVQSLAGSLTALGGIGIAKMISTQLHRMDEKAVPDAKNAAPQGPAGVRPGGTHPGG